MSDLVFLSGVRLSFPHLAEPQKRVSPETGKERLSYSGDFLMAPDHPGFKQLMAKINEMALAKWKEHAGNVLNLINADRKLRCYGDGNQKVNSKTFQPYDGYAGNVYVTAGRDNPPQIIQADGTPVDPTNSMAYQARPRHPGRFGGRAVRWRRQAVRRGRRGCVGHVRRCGRRCCPGTVVPAARCGADAPASVHERAVMRMGRRTVAPLLQGNH
jgi:hypothetical protein